MWFKSYKLIFIFNLDKKRKKTYSIYRIKKVREKNEMTIKRVIIPVITFIEVPIDEQEDKQEAYNAAIDKVWDYGIYRVYSERYLCIHAQTNEGDDIKDKEITNSYSVEFIEEED